MGASDTEEYVMAVNVADGATKWTTPIGERLKNNWGDGPRSTPTVDGERVYALSGRGSLACLNSNDGGVVWKVNMKDFGGGVPGWGYCESVLIDGEKLLCTPGGKQGTILALDKTSGGKARTSPTARSTPRSSPPITAASGSTSSSRRRISSAWMAPRAMSCGKPPSRGGPR
jgi:outer membrane protein assembly factor BamB